MTQFDTPDLESDANDLDDRDVRALTEYLTVLPEGHDLFTVVSQSGAEYTVDARNGACTCDDYRYREPAVGMGRETIRERVLAMLAEVEPLAFDEMEELLIDGIKDDLDAALDDLQQENEILHGREGYTRAE